MDNQKTYRAMDVLVAAQKAFSSASDNPDYAVQKGNSFLYRCGAVLEKGPDQRLKADAVEAIAHAMLDSEIEITFFRSLSSAQAEPCHRNGNTNLG